MARKTPSLKHSPFSRPEARPGSSLGRVAFRKGDHARALACADAYFAEGGSAYAGLVLRAQSLLELGDAAAFEAAVRQCEAHASCDVVPFVLRAEQARRSGDLKSEARHLADAVERYPGVFSARFRLANAWLVMGNCEQAVRVMSQANLSRLSEREIFFTADLMEKCRRSDLARQALDHVDPEGEFAGLELLMAALDGRVSPREALRRHAARRLREGPWHEMLMSLQSARGTPLERVASWFRRAALRRPASAMPREIARRLAAIEPLYEAAKAYGPKPGAAPLVSVICPVHRAEDVENLLGQLRRQTYPRIDVQIVINGPGIHAGQIEARLASRRFERLSVHTMADSNSLSRSLNHGMENATGEYLARFDADDRYLPDYLTNTVGFMQAQDADICGKAHFFTYLESCRAALLVKAAALPAYVVRGNHIVPSGATMVLRRGVWQALRFNEDLKISEDANFYVRAKAQGFVQVLAPPYDHVVIRKSDRWSHSWHQGDRLFLTEPNLFATGSLRAFERALSRAGRHRNDRRDASVG